MNERQKDQAWIESNRADNELMASLLDRARVLRAKAEANEASQWPRNLPAWKAQEPSPVFKDQPYQLVDNGLPYL